ncbi:MAG: single-stranded DNA-binding protein [Planctomycetota bacterium]
MSNYNKVLLMGRLTRDPELKYTQQGVPLCEIGIAVNRDFAGRDGGERRKETTFVDITFWRRRAEVISQYFKKGEPIFIEGRLSLDSWEGQDGQKRSKLRVVGDTFEFVGGRGGGGGGGGGGGYGGGMGAPAGGPPVADYAYPSGGGGAPNGGGGAPSGDGFSGGGSESWGAPASPPPGGDAIDDSDVPF